MVIGINSFLKKEEKMGLTNHEKMYQFSDYFPLSERDEVDWDKGTEFYFFPLPDGVTDKLEKYGRLRFDFGLCGKKGVFMCLINMGLFGGLGLKVVFQNSPLNVIMATKRILDKDLELGPGRQVTLEEVKALK